MGISVDEYHKILENLQDSQSRRSWRSSGGKRNKAYAAKEILGILEEDTQLAGGS